MNNENTTEVIVSICIANYNGHDVIRNCLDSIYRQEADIPIEVIIHDDASTDDSLEIIRTEYPDATLLVSNTNVGFCISNNRMVDAANGKYILLLNNDAALHSDAISTLHNFSKSQNFEGILSLPQFNMYSGELIDRGCTFDPFMNPVPVKRETYTSVGMVIGACLWIPRNTWMELGGFPEWFGSIAEDMLLCCHARLMGYKVLVLPSSYYKHSVGKSFGGGKVVSDKLKTTIKRRVLSERNKTFVMLATYPLIAIAIALPLHMIFLFIEGLALSVLNRKLSIFSKIYVSILPAIIEHWTNLRQLRNKILRKKTISYKEYFRPFRLAPWKLLLLYRHGLPKIR